MKPRLAGALAIFAWFVAALPIWAEGERCDLCGELCVSFKQVPKTIMVPESVLKKQTIMVVELVLQPRTLTFERYRYGTVTKAIPYTYDIAEPVQVSKQIQYNVPVAITKNIEHQYTVLVPKTITKHGVRKVSKVVPVVKKETYKQDRGCWDPDKCVWVPKIVTEEFDVTTYVAQYFDQPFEYCVTVPVPERRGYHFPVTDYKIEERTKTVAYTTYVMKKITGTTYVTELQVVPYTDTYTYTVPVPVPRERIIEVPCTRMVPKTVMVYLPICPRCNSGEHPPGSCPPGGCPPGGGPHPVPPPHLPHGVKK